MKDLFKLIRAAFWLALFGAIYQELRRPPEERTWHGKVAGVVPYDFRVPTLQQLRETYWDPESDHVFTDRVFGVGWGVNIPVAMRKISALADQYVSANRRQRTPRED
jgi:hypothetical protein